MADIPAQQLFSSTASPCVRCMLPPITIDPPQVTPPVQNTIEYVPYEKVVVEIKEVPRVERIPKQIWVTQYQTVKRVGKRPVQRTVTDYYTVQYITDYVEERVDERRTEMVEQEIIQFTTELIPVERSIVHYPVEAAGTINAKPIESRITYPSIDATRTPNYTLSLPTNLPTMLQTQPQSPFNKSATLPPLRQTLVPQEVFKSSQPTADPYQVTPQINYQPSFMSANQPAPFTPATYQPPSFNPINFTPLQSKPNSSLQPPIRQPSFPITQPTYTQLPASKPLTYQPITYRPPQRSPTLPVTIQQQPVQYRSANTYRQPFSTPTFQAIPQPVQRPPPQRRSLYPIVNPSLKLPFDQQFKDTLILQNLSDGFALQPTRNFTNRAKLQPLTGQTPQRFKLVSNDNSYNIASLSNNNYLDVNSPNQGAVLAFNPNNGKQTQKWYLDMISGSVCKLRNYADPELVAGRSQSGIVELQEDKNSKNQLWNVIGLTILGQ